MWSLGGQRIFYAKLASTLMISMKFCENRKENEKRRRIFIFLSIFCQTSC
eukprot:UN01170